MKTFKYSFALVLILVPLIVLAQTTATQPGTAPSQGSTTPNTGQAGGAMASSAAIKVLSPKVNEKIGSSAVTVRFQLQNTALAADPSPTYRVQLDGRDPVETTSTENSFTGLPDGEHTVTIDLVDANHTPIATSHTEERFSTFTPGTKGAAGSTSKTGSLTPPTIVKAKWELPEGKADELPAAAGELPLLSMLGFGVLVGGIVSAMRTRR